MEAAKGKSRRGLATASLDSRIFEEIEIAQLLLRTRKSGACSSKISFIWIYSSFRKIYVGSQSASNSKHTCRITESHHHDAPSIPITKLVEIIIHPLCSLSAYVPEHFCFGTHQRNSAGQLLLFRSCNIPHERSSILGLITVLLQLYYGIQCGSETSRSLDPPFIVPQRTYIGIIIRARRHIRGPSAIRICIKLTFQKKKKR